MRIIAFARARNEADIIEAFVRHTLAFAEALILLDHGSTDATPQILRQLVEEGLPLHLSHDATLGHRQVVQANQLLHRAVDEFGADWVLCLDADEFVEAPSVEAFRAVLASAAGPVKLLVRNYYAQPSDPPEEANPIRRITHYLRKAQPGDPVSEFKVVVPAALARTPGALLNQGNHEVLVEGHAADAVVPPDLFLAHFSLRSAPQYAAKLATAQFQRRRAISDAGDESSFLAPAYSVLRQSYSAFVAQFFDFRVSYVQDQPDDILVRQPAAYRGGDLRYQVHREAIDSFVSEVLDMAEVLASSGSREGSNQTELKFAFDAIVLPEPGHKEVLHRTFLPGQWTKIDLALDSPAAATALRLRIAAAPGLLEIRRLEVVAEDDQALVWTDAAKLEANLRIEEGGVAIWSPVGHRILTCKFPLVFHLELGPREKKFVPKRLRLECAFMPGLPSALVLRSEVLNPLNHAPALARAEANARADRLEAELAQLRSEPARPSSPPPPAPVAAAPPSPPILHTRYRPGDRIDFAEHGNATLYQVGGWSHPEPWGTWTDGPLACLRLVLTRQPAGLAILHARIRPFLPPGKRARGVALAVNGQVCAQWRFAHAGSQRVWARIPRKLLASNPVEIEFRIEPAESPHRLGLSIDGRRLGLGFEHLSLGGLSTAFDR